jgi:hypothetical protein
VLKQRLRLAGHLIKQDRAFARAAKRMPRPVPWDWARPRLVPLLAGPSLDEPGVGVVRATAGPGCAVEIGMDLGGAFAIVDEIVAERWECSPGQLLEAGLHNLRRRLAKVGPADAVGGAFSGRIIRQLELPGGCAASVALLPDELMRIFGDHDQVLAAISIARLVSFPIDTPVEVLADAVIDMEMGEPLPLLYDPFVLVDGRLVWQPPDDDEGQGYADCARDWPAA